MAIQKYLDTQDYFLTKEKFTLYEDDAIDLLITHPKPSEQDLLKYYESENYISHHSKKSIFHWIYQKVKEINFKNKLTLLNSLPIQHKSILDIGCGNGDFLQYCVKQGWEGSGVEPVVDAFKMASEKNPTVKMYRSIEDLLTDSFSVTNHNTASYKETKLYYHQSYTQYNLNPSQTVAAQENNQPMFDVITLWHVLEHVSDLDTYIYKLKKLLKPNGYLVIAVPNYKSYDATYYGKFWAAFDVPRHLWHFSQTSIHRLFATEFMQVVKTIPLKFDAYYIALMSEYYKTGIKNFFKAIYIGYLSNRKAKRSNEYSSLIYVLNSMKNDLK